MDYVKPHAFISRDVEEHDIERVLKEAALMSLMLNVPHGLHAGAYAIAHSQVCAADPLRFFVMEGRTIVNPYIISQSTLIDLHPEGCMSFPTKGSTRVIRHHRITVGYLIIKQRDTGEYYLHKTSAVYANLKAYIYQHELDHMDGIYVFPIL